MCNVVAEPRQVVAKTNSTEVSEVMPASHTHKHLYYFLPDCIEYYSNNYNSAVRNCGLTDSTNRPKNIHLTKKR